MRLAKLSGYWEFTFQTQRFDTGVATDADSTPTYRVYEENNDAVVESGNCAKRDDANTTGYYYCRSQVLSSVGYEVGKTYEVRVEATVNGVSGAAVIGRFAVIPAVVWDSLYGGTANLPADVAAISGDTDAADNLAAACNGGQYNLGGGAIVAASVTGNVSGNVQGNVLGTVGGVSGDVTGNVQGTVGGVSGNVTGSVNSVTQPVTLTSDYNAAKTAAQAGDAMNLTAAAVDAIIDEAVEGSYTLRQALRVILAVLAGKVSGMNSLTPVFRDINDTKNRVTASTDASGNRTSVTLDVT